MDTLSSVNYKACIVRSKESALITLSASNPYCDMDSTASPSEFSSTAFLTRHQVLDLEPLIHQQYVPCIVRSRPELSDNVRYNLLEQQDGK